MAQIFADIFVTANITVKMCSFYAPHIFSQIFAPKITEKLGDFFVTVNITVIFAPRKLDLLGN